jgi:hypothetical protein
MIPAQATDDAKARLWRDPVFDELTASPRTIDVSYPPGRAR